MSELRVGASTTTGGVDTYRYVQTVTFTSSGTFAKADYPWLRAISIKCVGGGGGGGGAGATGSNENSVASGGSSGGYAESFNSDIAGLASSITVTRGAGGGGGIGYTVGNAGGVSSFGSLVVAQGGAGGAVSKSALFPVRNTISAGNTSFTGDTVIYQRAGERGIGFSTASERQYGGSGGSSPLGAGGFGVNGNNSAGTNGQGYGGGGGGAANNENQSAVNGGDGSDGVVIVELYA